MQTLSQKIRQLIVLTFCLCASAYFSYHTIYGRYGLEARSKIMERHTLLKVEMESLNTVRAKLQNEVTVLSSAAPHSDLVEEISADVLGYVYPGDSVLLLP